MNYGFVIDNDSCIGCHACSTACKSENEVPLGVQRTWVKSVETGLYPNVRRNFQVTRCNHCANPPCVRICPVTAMYQRGDGIVEFDPDVCIGCKACMQACPYDAIYIDPETHTAAKCHYCAHRLDVGLEPACVVVCPEHAILAGDLDDPTTEIAKAVAENKVTVRKPEQGTAPKLYYIGGDDTAMHPTATERTPNSFAWADVIPLGGGRPRNADAQPGAGDGASGDVVFPEKVYARTSKSGSPIRTPSAQGHPVDGPIMIGQGRMAEQMTQVVYNAQHKVPWHWQVPAYLVTKGIASGLFMLFASAAILGAVTFHVPTMLGVAMTAVVFLAVTTVLLVLDLERPERFLRILTRPQMKSWLTRGAFLLVGFSALTSVWWAAEFAGSSGWIDAGFVNSIRPVLLWIGLPLAFGTAVYTAFLFGQAEGRDLWQSPLLPIHFMVQAVMAGAAFVPLLDQIVSLDVAFVELSMTVFGIAVAVDLAITLIGEFGMPHATETAAAAAHMITHGKYSRHFWIGNIALGHLAPLGLLFLGDASSVFIASLATLIGLYLYEYVFVLAPQEIPNS